MEELKSLKAFLVFNQVDGLDGAILIMFPFIVRR